MKRIFKTIPLLSILLTCSCGRDKSDSLSVLNPRCEYMNEAVIAKQSPRFSWELASTENGQKQTAWQVIVGDDEKITEAGKGNIWNSGKITSNETFGIKMKGNSLKSFTQYYWKVRVWDSKGKATGWSETARFITGAFDKKEWKAQWIGDNPESPLEYPLVYKHIGYLSSYTDNENEEKWVQIDLGQAMPFDRIRIYPSFNNMRNIKEYYFPPAFRVELSTDGSVWERCDFKNSPDRAAGEPADLVINQLNGRYVRFTAVRLKRYDHRNYDYEDKGDPSKMYAFSLAELEVMNGDKILSKGCRTTYKDALIKIDREDGYDPDMLTDGITGTPPPPERRSVPPSPLLRKTIRLREKPAQALAYVSALGVYEISLNGQMPDDRVLAPEWTDYNKRVQYQLFDVTALLDAGTNVIGAQLADGWYAGMLGPTRWSEYFPKRGVYGLDRRLFLQLEIKYAGGDKETIVSDGTWKIFKNGPIRMADNFLGETYNAGNEVTGWTGRSFSDSAWDNVVTDMQKDINLVPQVNQPVKVIETLEARSVTKTKEGNYLFDAGENITGWCNISLEGKPGDRIVLRHGEILDDSGELYTDNLGAAVQTDTVILGLSGKLQYEPRFTFHGFRYVEVSGLRKYPDKSILQVRVIASDQPQSGTFSCSDPMLNQLYKNINRSHISNMTGIPTDCPQRDERCGWMGDVYIFAQTSIFNRDMAAFYNKWMVDILDAQTERGTFPDIAPHPFAFEKHFTNAPGWADAAIKLPWLLYVNYGDKEIIADHFESYERYIENIRKSNPDLIWRSGLGLNYGDWLNGNTLNAEGFPKTGAQIPSEVFSTIMFFNSVNTLSKMATVLGKNEKAAYYSGLAAQIRSAFREHFVKADGIIEGDAQSCYAMALYYDIYTKEMEKTFEKRMIDKFIPYSGRMNTGFHSTLCLMKELVKRGYEKKAFELLETKEFPSWGYSIDQGATSVWERWDGFVKGRGFQGAGMNSFNHYAFGAIGEWMYENIIGIQPDPDSPGYRHFILKPLPGGSLSWARGSYNSISGKIDAAWEKEGKRFKYDFTIPPNTTATVCIPGISAGSVLVSNKKPADLNGQIKPVYKDGYTIFELPAGTWTAISEL